MTTALDELIIEAIHLGPTWEPNPEWDGESPHSQFVLPERTLGWQILDWIEANLQSDETDEHGQPIPFKPTREQTRFILWWYAVDSRGRFCYREGILQRLKGWGKDPLAAVLAAVEFVGPCRFASFATENIPSLNLVKGEPVAKPHPRAWIQVAAVSREQTQNTMRLFPGLFSKACIKEHSINIGKEVIYAYHGQRMIQSVTSSPRTLEGGRATFVIKNETHHWLANNEGHAMASVIGRNATKAKDAAARVLSITNAYEPSEDSVAQHEREAWEAEHAGLAIDTGVLYDSLEAPEHAALKPPRPKGAPEPTDEEVKAYLATVIRAVRGDALWLDVENIVMAILDRKVAPSTSRRFWFNQVVTAEDAWVTAAAVEAAEDPLARDMRAHSTEDADHAGWDLISPTDEVAMFFDGSKSDDDTALTITRLSDLLTVVIGVWHKPPGERGKGWVVPRHDVDNRVEEAFERFTIVAFRADPSHTADDDGSRYWDGMINDWHRRYKDDLPKEHWSIKSGDGINSIMWDMTSPERTRLFTAAAERFVEMLERKDDVEEPAPAIHHDGHPALKQHFKNARRYPNKFGVSLWKGGRESPKKIDLAVCAVGSAMLAELVLNRGLEEEKPAGKVWGAW